MPVNCAGFALAEGRLFGASLSFEPGAKIAVRGSSTVPAAQPMQEPAAVIVYCIAKTYFSLASTLALMLSVLVGLQLA